MNFFLFLSSVTFFFVSQNWSELFTSATGSSHIVTGCRKRSYLALTFDDGPTENYKLALKNLKKAKAIALFHVSPKQIHEEITRKRIYHILSAGHDIGFQITSVNAEVSLLVKQLKDARSRIMNDFKYEVIFVRLPYKKTLPVGLMEELVNLNFIVTEGNTDSLDYDRQTSKKEDVYDRIARALESYSVDYDAKGPILVQRDLNAASLHAIVDIVELTKDQSFRVVSMSQCVGLEEDFNERDSRRVSSSSQETSSSTTTLLSSSSSDAFRKRPHKPRDKRHKKRINTSETSGIEPYLCSRRNTLSVLASLSLAVFLCFL